MSTRLPVDERRAWLIHAAAELAEQNGVVAVTTREVARAAGVSLGVVHYCFASKEELMTEVIKSFGANARNIVESTLELAELPEQGPQMLRTLIHTTLDAVWEDITARRNRHVLMSEITTRALREDPDAWRLDLARSRYRFDDEITQGLLAQLAAASGSTFQIPLATASRTIIAMMDGIVLRWLVDGEVAAAQEQLGIMVDLLVSQAR